MNKIILKYGVILGAAIILLKGLEYVFFIRLLPTPYYVVMIALLFTGLGIWLGRRLTSTQKPEPGVSFQRNEEAIASLDISARELEVLEHLAKGKSNQEIADTLFISINTVKTHLSKLYQKLNVSRRSLAVKKARALKLIP